MTRSFDEGSVAQVRYASHLARNLESIEAFWIENGFPERYDRLLDALAEVVVPNLQRHPGIGRLFLERTVDSVEAERLNQHIGARLSALLGEAQIREYVMDDCLVLYSIHRGGPDHPLAINLMAIVPNREIGL